MDESLVTIRGCHHRVYSSSKLQFGESILKVGGVGLLCVHRAKTPVAEATQFVWHDAPPAPASLPACTPVVHDAPPVAASLPYRTPPWRVALPVVVSLPACAPVEQVTVELPKLVVDDANPPSRSSVEEVVENHPKRVAGNVKLKKRLLKAEADGDIKRMAELRAKRSGCQKKKKSKARQGIALGMNAA
jgi:hypothetical protein